MALKPDFTTYDEISNLPGFQEENLITIENFDHVYANYQIKDTELYCCLISERGLCNHAHNYGYVIKLKNGSLSIMGNNCAEKKFGANGSIVKGISLYKNTQEAKTKLGRVFFFAESRDEYQLRLEVLSSQLERMKQFYSELPLIIGYSNIQKLNERYKANKTKIEVKSYNLGEPDPDYPEVENLIYVATHTIGSIPFLDIFDNKNLDDFEKKLNHLKVALRDAIKIFNQLMDGNNIPTSDIRKRTGIILSQLNDFDNFETKVKASLKDIDKFNQFDPEPLCFLTDNKKLSLNFIELSLKFNNLNDVLPQTYIRKLEIKYATKFKCHRIKAADHGFNTFNYYK